MHRIFIGYDPRSAITYNVLQHSIAIRSKAPVNITPLILEQLPVTRTGLTSFTWSRFLVPWLCNYEGWALFLDADMLCRDDIGELFALGDEDQAVMVVQSPWRFEWASLMLFNCGHPDNRILTPEHVQTANGLHGINWTENVGDLPRCWNRIVLYDEDVSDAKIVHYTGGIPVFPETSGHPFTGEYHEETRFLVSTQPWGPLMGNSVHAKRVLDAKKAQEQLAGGTSARAASGD